MGEQWKTMYLSVSRVWSMRQNYNKSYNCLLNHTKHNWKESKNVINCKIMFYVGQQKLW